MAGDGTITEADWQADTAGTLSGDWSQVTHWSTGTIPGPGDAVVIADNPVATTAWTVSETSQDAASLTLDMTLGTLEAAAGLTVQGTLSQALGTLLLRAGATASVAALVQTGGSVLLDGSGDTPTQLLSSGTDSLDGSVTLAGAALWSDAAVAIGAGTLALGDGSTVDVGSRLSLIGSFITLDATGDLDVGSGTGAVQGALNVAVDGGVTVDGGTIAAGLDVAGFFDAWTGTLDPSDVLITGNVIATGEVDVSAPVTVQGTFAVNAGSLSIASGGTLDVGALLVESGSGVTLWDGTLNSTGSGDAVYANVSLANGAVWNTTALAIVDSLANLIGTTSATLMLSASTIADVGTLIAGCEEDPAYGNFTSGTIALQSGSRLTASGLLMNYRSALLLSPTAAVVLGDGTAVAGAVVIGAGATLSSDQGQITGNVIVAAGGSLNAHGRYLTGDDQLPGDLRIDGTLSGSGTVSLANADTLELGDATGFSGSLVFSDVPQGGGPTLQLDMGDLPDAPIRPAYPGASLRIDLRGLAYDGGAITAHVGASPSQLVVSDATASATLDLIAPGQGLSNFTFGNDAVYNLGDGGTMVFDAPCYVAGTRIATASGAVPVAALRPGDLVRTVAGRVAPVRWVGRRYIDLARHRRPWRVAPVRIAAHAIAAGVPVRDLFVSPEHGIFVAGRLVPAGLLANGATIARQDGWASVTYVHIELDRHEIVLAENCPAETYLDTGNRALFANGPAPRPLHPDLSGSPDPAALAVWARHGAAPLLLEGEALASLRTALIARAEALGWARTALGRPTLLADGAPVPLKRAAEGAWRARLPRSVRRLQLGSASFIPAEVQPGSGDPRRLGLAVRDVRLDSASLPPTALAGGWHAAEAGFRWTDGAAEILLASRAGPATFEVLIAAGGLYWLAPQHVERARRRA